MKPTCHRAGVPDHGHGRTGTASPPHRGGAALLLLASLLGGTVARADDPPTTNPTVRSAGAEAASDAAWAALAEGRLAEAVEAARDLAQRDRARAPEAAYLLGIARWELGDPEGALLALADVVTHWPDTSWAQDATFRRAAYLAGLGQLAEARAALTTLGPWKRFSAGDQRKLALCDLTWRLRERGAPTDLRALLPVLEGSAPDDPQTLFLAYGWLAVLDHHAARASSAAFVGADGAQRREVRAVGAALTEAELALGHLADLPEPGVRVDGALHYAEALAAVADALDAGDVPARLTPEQQAAYRQGLRDRAVGLWGKALAVVELSRGALRTTGPVAAAQLADLDALAARITSRLR